VSNRSSDAYERLSKGYKSNGSPPIRLLPTHFATVLTASSGFVAMPKPSASTKSIYAWTTGTQRKIIPEGFIGLGGFAEVHKVSPFLIAFSADMFKMKFRKSGRVRMMLVCR
jgi:hypothetical protein